MVEIIYVICPECNFEFSSDMDHRNNNIIISCPNCDLELPASEFERVWEYDECCKACEVCEYSEACDSNGRY